MSPACQVAKCIQGKNCGVWTLRLGMVFEVTAFKAMGFECRTFSISTQQTADLQNKLLPIIALKDGEVILSPVNYLSISSIEGV